MNKNKEFETHADIDGERVAVVVYYELDGYKPFINNICIQGTETDIIDELYVDEFDRIYAEVCTEVAGND